MQQLMTPVALRKKGVAHQLFQELKTHNAENGRLAYCSKFGQTVEMNYTVRIDARGSCKSFLVDRSPPRRPKVHGLGGL